MLELQSRRLGEQMDEKDYVEAQQEGFREAGYHKGGQSCLLWTNTAT